MHRGVLAPDGSIMCSLLSTNIHVFPHPKQQKYLKSDECKFNLFGGPRCHQLSLAQESLSTSFVFPPSDPPTGPRPHFGSLSNFWIDCIIHYN